MSERSSSETTTNALSQAADGLNDALDRCAATLRAKLGSHARTEAWISFDNDCDLGWAHFDLGVTWDFACRDDTGNVTRLTSMSLTTRLFATERLNDLGRAITEAADLRVTQVRGATERVNEFREKIK